MKGLGTIVTLFLIIAAAGAVVSVLQLAIVALLLVALITQPHATLTFFASMIILSLVASYPWIMLPIIVFGAVGGALKARRSEPRD